MPTRWMLVGALVVVIASVTLASLLVVRARMSRQVLDDISGDLSQSVQTFQSLQAQQRAALQRENALLGRLPSLKALMTTHDDRTIVDEAVEFWHVAGNDLFALAEPNGRVVAAYTQGAPATPELVNKLSDAVTEVDKHYLLSDGRLFEYSVRPLYFGSETTGSLLGYVISGYAIDATFVRHINRSSSAQVAFITGNDVVTSTLPQRLWGTLGPQSSMIADGDAKPQRISLEGERYLVVAKDLSAGARSPLRLIVLKSFDEAEQAQRQINRLLWLIGIFAVLIGTVLMLLISSIVTAPLEQLAKCARAFGAGESQPPLPVRGPLEVKELSAAFSVMQSEIQETNSALLEAERLATIGRMASSVSHDLRHYLAAVYANAEFLASSNLSEQERAELLLEIRSAVQGTTELIDSLLIFSRTGRASQRNSEQVSSLVDQALALVRTHPDSENVVFHTNSCDARETNAFVDGRQIERGIYNLLLNACQSARRGGEQQDVIVDVSSSATTVSITITDTGPGVPSAIRGSLFEPFVSEGKQNGTGLGLTLTQSIAREHGGDTTLVSSRPGETIFMLTILRGPKAAQLEARSNATVRQ